MIPNLRSRPISTLSLVLGLSTLAGCAGEAGQAGTPGGSPAAPGASGVPPINATQESNGAPASNPGTVAPALPGAPAAPGAPPSPPGVTPQQAPGAPSPQPGEAPREPTPPGMVSPPVATPASPVAIPDPAPGGLRRLTPDQYKRSLSDVLGDLGPLPEVEGLPAGDELIAIAAATTAITPTGVEDYEKVTNTALSALFSDAGRRDGLVGCSTDTWNDGCVTDLIARVGLKAWRRPVTDAEMQRYKALAQGLTEETGAFEAGTRAVLSAMLQSPNFLYRAELGSEGQATELTPFEKASRMSYTLWGTTPDDDLLTAAANGSLETEAGLQGQARRLLESPRLEQGAEDLVADLLSLDAVFLMAKDRDLFPELTPTLREAMKDELVMLFQDLALAESKDLLELFDTKKTFVNEELGALYGIEVDGEQMRAAEHTPEAPRSGILTSALLLSVRDKLYETSPTRRGEFVSTVLNCIQVPPAPDGVDTTLPEPQEGVIQTRRELLTKHMTDPSCAGCHALMDPVGLALENFDALGRYRTHDENNLLIDASGVFEGVQFANPEELGPLMRASQQVRGCMMRRIYSFASGRTTDPFDRVQLEKLEGAMPAGQVPFKALMTELVTNPDFYKISPPTQ